ncbi:MAG: peptidoglycan-binding protein [Oscillospiraceae bacterium]|jgi:peptidoglycan hydrolase-like protein with peptidoglycan-binding domain|nr:peptidoglycan-binding protein [Oscillospiraceae bacterium]
MGQGYLKIAAQTASGALPVEGAQVVIADHSGRTLYTLTTDSSGQTESVSLCAPDRSTTMQPGGEAYSTYNVTVSKDGFVTETVIGAEVLDTIHQTQPVYLNAHFEGGGDAETIVVADNALKQESPQMQQSGPRLSPRVLNDVIIPAAITVHMGDPNDAGAKNITVRFPDYVKNVVASEIYATWPQASLEANTYAIISLALNRVYTEWYRSRRYNFDITNSTRYDQYFKEGQTIPDNISQIVDRIYNQYIRRVGYKEPLFSSYCNGTTATCSGMSQWGSVTLANSGYSAVNILKNYYGNNIEIARTDKVSGVLSSYPGYPLSQGSVSAQVSRMQTYLNRIATNFPAIGKVSEDGKYSAATAAAVREFQGIFGLPQTGVIDQATWNKISYIYVAVTKLAELDSEGQRIGVGVSPPTVVLRRGASGADVVQLQFLLNAIGTYYPSIPPIAEDGAFGANTADAVRAFQRRFGLSADGIVGPATWKKLYAVYKSLGLGTGGGGGVPPYPGTLLSRGSTGNDVRTLQTYINKLAETSPTVPKIGVDGIFGPKTEAAVTAAQKLLGLDPDGIAGPATWGAVVK